MNRTICLAACVVASAGVAAADDVLAPTWRGEPDTVVAAWDSDFSLSDWWAEECEGTLNPPDFLDGPGGNAEYEGRTMIARAEAWQVRGPTVYMDNCNVPRPEKWVRLQVTWWPGADELAFADVWYGSEWLGDPDVTVPLVAVDQVTHADGWVTTAYDFILQPNPTEEVFRLVPAQGTSYVDQFVIDTWCVPEPATLSLLALGAAALLRRRRGSTEAT